MTRSPLGSSLDDLLIDDGILEEVTEEAAKRVLARSLAARIEDTGLKKTAIAKKMKSSRSQLDRLLSETDTGVTLHSIIAAAFATDSRIRITFEPNEGDGIN